MSNQIMTQRIILQLDLDSFYASAEEVRNPELKGKPVVVCVFSGRTEDSGAVATSNYLARESGIKAGMYIAKAKEIAAKETIFLPTDMEYYKQVSERIMEIIRSYSDRFEQRSIDEAYLDLSGLVKDFEEAQALAEKLKKDVFEKEGITCSVGIGPNKLVAKMASKVKKPDGLTIIRPEDVRNFLNPLPAKKLFGIGPKSLEFFEKIGIKTIEDLAKTDVKSLVDQFGEKKGRDIREHANGIDNSEVEETERQQLSKIGTLKEDSSDLDFICEKLFDLIEELKIKIEKEGKKFKSVSIIVILANLQTHTKSRSLENFTDDIQVVKTEAKNLMKEFLENNPGKKLRRCGVRVSGFEDSALNLTEPSEKKQKTLFSFGK